MSTNTSVELPVTSDVYDYKIELIFYVSVCRRDVSTPELRKEDNSTSKFSCCEWGFIAVRWVLLIVSYWVILQCIAM